MTTKANAHILYLGAGAGDTPETLERAARQTWEFQRADPAEEVEVARQANGLAIVFLKDPIAPVQCAIEIAWSRGDAPDRSPRFGIHSGPVAREEGEAFY